MKRNHYFKLTIIALFLSVPFLTYGQSSEREESIDCDTNEPGVLLWNLKAGGMLWNRSLPDIDEKSSATDILAGLGLEIPINKKFNIETGLRWKYIWALLNTEDYNPYVNGSDKTSEQMHLLELPVRLTYKWQLKDNLSLHLGAGPYASMPIAYSFSGDDSFIKDEPRGKLHVGLETAAVLYWGNFNIGAHYNIPFYKGYEDGYNNRVELTLGIRFKSKIWGKIGAGVVAIDDALRASGTYDAINSLAGNNGSNSNVSVSNNSSNNYSKPTSTSKKKLSLSEKQNYDNDKRVYERYDSMLSKHFFGTQPATEKEVKEWQAAMKKLRTNWEKKGMSFPHSDNESR